MTDATAAVDSGAGNCAACGGCGDRAVVGITHAEADIGCYYADKDLARLHAHAEVRVLGAAAEAGFTGRLAAVDVLTGSWGMPALSGDLLSAAPRLRAVCYAAGSIKGFATPAAYQRGIVISSAAAANAVPVAEVTVALITLANKRWFFCQDRIRRLGAAGWRDPSEPPHPGNYDSVVGLIGLGAVGREVARRLQAMDLDVLVYDPHVSAAEAGGYDATAVPLDVLAARSDVVSVHAPNIDACAGMIDAAFLARLKDGATLINTARGRLVCEDALVAELRRGRLFAMLDVTHPEPPPPGHPFYSLPNCWLTPHRAGSSSREIRRLGRLAVDECLRAIRGAPLAYAVAQAQLATMA